MKMQFFEIKNILVIENRGIGDEARDLGLYTKNLHTFILITRLIIQSQSQSEHSVNSNSHLFMNYVDIFSSGKGGNMCKSHGSRPKMVEQSLPVSGKRIPRWPVTNALVLGPV